MHMAYSLMADCHIPVLLPRTVKEENMGICTHTHMQTSIHACMQGEAMWHLVCELAVRAAEDACKAKVTQLQLACIP